MRIEIGLAKSIRGVYEWKGTARERIFGHSLREQVRDMGIEEVLSAPRSPWQRAYVERVIGSIRRECLDHEMVFDERSLRQTLASSFDYYHQSRTHLSLGKDAPERRRFNRPKSDPL
jgi:transposase InsO family protein